MLFLSETSIYESSKTHLLNNFIDLYNSKLPKRSLYCSLLLSIHSFIFLFHSQAALCTEDNKVSKIQKITRLLLFRSVFLRQLGSSAEKSWLLGSEDQR